MPTLISDGSDFYSAQLMEFGVRAHVVHCTTSGLLMALATTTLGTKLTRRRPRSAVQPLRSRLYGARGATTMKLERASCDRPSFGDRRQ